MKNLTILLTKSASYKVDSDFFYNELKGLMGVDVTYNLEAKYHYELAINNYYSAIQMHNEGKEYKENLNKMFFLQDDFNDNLYHFCAANERYRINSGVIREKITWLKQQVESSRFYDYKYYVDKDI